jgi:hypothetical protein
MKRTKKSSLLMATAAVAGVAMGAGIALAHQAIPLYTYEEVAQQFGAPAMPVMASRVNNQGMPYSPKQTCSTATPGINTGACHDYTALADHAFHASLGFNEWMDNDPSGLFIGDGSAGGAADGIQTGLNPQKPWLQSHGHNGKW